MVVTVNRSEIRTKPILQIVEEMEAITKEALKLARELEEYFKSIDFDDMDITRDTE